jgi:UDPglucose--hexose-1-phosphate uridylyltransferase
MNAIGFKKEITKGIYLDPLNRFEKKEIIIEERYDETTGVASRILPYRTRSIQKPDINIYLERSPESACPFCSGQLEKNTPRFTEDIATEGKFKQGESCMFPNAFPYDQSGTVAIFSSRHLVPIEDLTSDYMQDGFAVCCDYFNRIAKLKRGYRYCSINWNYMPQSGGGLIHPHLQTIAGIKPTSFMERILAGAHNYSEKNGGACLWSDLIVFEKKADERLIADTGSICWLAPFSPKGMAGEIDFIFKDQNTIIDLSDLHFKELLNGLNRIFNYLSAGNYISFNFTMYAAMTPKENFRVQGKIIPRFELNNLGTSDLNYFEKLHNEIICTTVPEKLCKELQSYFNIK